MFDHRIREPQDAKLRKRRGFFNSLGYNAGPVDGEMGPRTRQAIRDFQRDNGLRRTGGVTDELLATLRNAPPPDVSTSVAGGFVIFSNTNLPQSDYRSGMRDPELKGISVAACQRYCAVDRRCASFTYNSKHQICFLKEGTPPREPFLGAISGIKRTATEAAQAQIANSGAVQADNNVGSTAVSDMPAGYVPTYTDFVNMALMSDREAFLEDATSTGVAYILATSTQDECRQISDITSGRSSEFDRQDFLKQAEMRARTVFAELDGKPKRVTIPIEAEYGLDTYDEARHGFPLKPSYSTHDAIVEAGTVVLPGGDPPSWCFASYGFTQFLTTDANVFFNLVAEHPDVKAAQILPMNEADARALRGAGVNDVLLKATLAVEPRDHGRGPLKGSIIAVAAYNPQTGDLLHVFDLSSSGAGNPAPSTGPAPLTYDLLTDLLMPVVEPGLQQDDLDRTVISYLQANRNQIDKGNLPPGLPLSEDQVRNQPAELVARLYRDQLRKGLETGTVDLPIDVVAEQVVYPQYREEYGLVLDDFVGHEWIGYTIPTPAELLDSLYLSSRDLPVYGHLSFLTEGPKYYEKGLGFRQAMLRSLGKTPWLELDKLLRAPAIPMSLKEAAAHRLFTDGSTKNAVVARWVLEIDGVRLEKGHPLVSAKLKKLSFRWRATGEPLSEIDVAALPTISGLRAEVADKGPKSASDLPVAPPADGLPLSAETVDLLQLKLVPGAATDPFFERMMMARYAYEQETNGDDPPVWGRFFLDSSGDLTDEKRAELLPKFKDWTQARVAALPASFTIPLELGYGSVTGESSFSGTDNVELDSTCGTARRNESSGEALSEKDAAALRMCDFLDAARQIPDDYVFLRDRTNSSTWGHPDQGAGPRYRCGSEPYCGEIRYAREALGLAVKSEGSFVGPYDLVHIDKWPVIDEALRNSDEDRIVQLRFSVTGASQITTWPDTSWIKALRLAKPFADLHGLDGVYVHEQAGLPIPALAFEARVVGAKLVDAETGKLVQVLSLAISASCRRSC